MPEQPGGLIDKETLALVPTIDLVNALRDRAPNGFILVMDDDEPEHDFDWHAHYGKSFDRTLTLLKYVEWEMHAGWAQTNWKCNPDAGDYDGPSR